MTVLKMMQNYTIGEYPPDDDVRFTNTLAGAMNVASEYWDAAYGMGDDYPVIAIWDSETAEIVAIFVEGKFYRLRDNQEAK